jgi:hypothetical protein
MTKVGPASGSPALCDLLKKENVHKYVSGYRQLAFTSGTDTKITYTAAIRERYFCVGYNHPHDDDGGGKHL